MSFSFFMPVGFADILRHCSKMLMEDTVALCSDLYTLRSVGRERKLETVGEGLPSQRHQENYCCLHARRHVLSQENAGAK